MRVKAHDIALAPRGRHAEEAEVGVGVLCLDLCILERGKVVFKHKRLGVRVVLGPCGARVAGAQVARVEIHGQRWQICRFLCALPWPLRPVR